MQEKFELIKNDLVKQTSKNPIVVVKNIMHNEYVSIHGPEHHFLDGGAFLVAYKNAGGEIDLHKALDRLAERAIKMPGAMCGYWGVCGAVASLGATLSVLHNTSPLSSDEHYKEHMQFTSKVIARMSEIGGPRCCKRNAFIALSMAVEFVKDKYGVALEMDKVECEFSGKNVQCIGKRCPFHM